MKPHKDAALTIINKVIPEKCPIHFYSHKGYGGVINNIILGPIPLFTYSVVSVDLPSLMFVGRVEVCATLSDAAVATERDFMITLATSNGTALGKCGSYIVYLKL